MMCYDNLTEDETEVFSYMCQDGEVLDYEVMKRLDSKIIAITQSLVDKGKITHLQKNEYEIDPDEVHKWVEWAEWVDDQGVEKELEAPPPQ